MPRGFILQASWRAESGQPVVRLLGKLETGQSFLVRVSSLRPTFWIRARDAATARSVGAAPRETDATVWTGEPAAEVAVRVPSDVPALRNALHEAGVRTFEADVRFAYRPLIDRGIRGALSIEGASREGAAAREGVDVVFDDPEMAPADWSPELRVLSVDIETDPRARRLLSVALAGGGVDEVHLFTPQDFTCPDGARPYLTERELLEAVVTRVREIDPDVITGWNVVDFDLAVLQRIGEMHRVPMVLGRGRDPLVLRSSLSPRGGSEARVTGRVVLDGIDLVRGAFLRYDSYSLDSVAREVLGEGKTVTGDDRAAEILEMFRYDRPRFVEYNRRDAHLVLEILAKLRLVELAVERSRLTGMTPDRVAASIASFDFLYLTELRRRRIAAPTVESARLSEGMGGGHVLEPVPGLHENVVVMDFKSLYPSVIRTFQIDPLGWTGRTSRRGAEADAASTGDPNAESSAAAGPIRAPNGAEFSREPGILPAILDDLFPRREEAKRTGDAVKSQAIKILMNSFYGVLGTPACRFFAPDIANAITSFGRTILLEAKSRVEARGLRVLYGDTDSLFVESGAADAPAARRAGEALVAELNAELREHIARTWRVESRLELEFERVYRKLLFPEMRGGGGSARKRYAGLVDAPEPFVEFTGMEVVRRDVTEVAKVVQRALYAKLFAGEPVEAYLKEMVAEVRAGRHDALLVYRKGLRKALESYTANTPPHVAAARKLGPDDVGRVVAYVVTRDGPEPVGRARAPIDREHYVQKQVRSVAEPVLAVLGLEFDAVVGDDTQMSLF